MRAQYHDRSSNPSFSGLMTIPEEPIPFREHVVQTVDPETRKRAHYSVSSQERTVTEWQRPIKRVCRSHFRVPCKARGLSIMHNDETAFFDIPMDAPHGLVLCCSHAECARSGRRFRYCRVCQMPVAKRNFLKRHGHGLVNSPVELKNDVDNIYGVPIPVNGANNYFLPSNTEGMETENSNSCQRTFSFDGPSNQSDVNVVGCRTVSFDVACDETEANGTNKSNPKYHDLTDFERQWLSLLDKRPEVENRNDMTKWMDTVVSHSLEHRQPNRRMLHRSHHMISDPRSLSYNNHTGNTNNEIFVNSSKHEDNDPHVGYSIARSVSSDMENTPAASQRRPDYCDPISILDDNFEVNFDF